MFIADALSEEMIVALRGIGENVALAKKLGVKPGTMSHGELMTLSELREGAKGPSVSHAVARSRTRTEGFSWRIASKSIAPR